MSSKRLLLGLLACLTAAPVLAQSTDPTNQQPTTGSSTSSYQPPDLGRPTESERNSLSGRGGPEAAGTRKTYNSVIGSQIYSTLGHPIDNKIAPQ